MNIHFPLRFGYIPYPLWRRKMPRWLRLSAYLLLRHIYPLEADYLPPATPDEMARYLARWHLLGDAEEHVARREIAQNAPPIEAVSDRSEPLPAPDEPVRLPAQWEPVKTVLLAWPVLYPRLWEVHACMVEAIAPVADVTIVVPAPMWASGIWWMLCQRDQTLMNRLRFLCLPTDDIWIRDYGPLIGLSTSGQPVAISAIFDPLPNYPQELDNAMAARWAAHHAIPLRQLDLHLEGGNLWSDGAGTLIMSEQLFLSNPHLTRAEVLARLRRALSFDKLIITPRLRLEETGHVDLLVKLADAQTILVSAPTSRVNGARLRAAADQLRHETNAAGQPYRVVELPTLPAYLNWGVFPIWRSYTNALTVNGRVLVPVYGEPTDAHALATYRRVMPTYQIVPIDCRIACNGGGAVHCLTKEIY